MASRHSKTRHQSLIVSVTAFLVNTSLSDEQSQKGMGPRILNVDGEAAPNAMVRGRRLAHTGSGKP